MLSYFDRNDKSLCYGCRSCEQACQKRAITMEEDAEGFLYPKLNRNQCIQCGRCESVCPQIRNDIEEPLIESQYPLVYAVCNMNKDIVKKSSSGGLFTVFADYVLSKGGAVFGCSFDKKWNPVHIIAENSSSLELIRGSKYVQSDVGNSFTIVRELLQNERMVLYTGTPCQIAGLKKFLNHDYEQLITIDLVCHGVPSNLFFHEYINYLEKRNKAQLIEYRFRDKAKYGWGAKGLYRIKKGHRVIQRSIFPTNDYYYYYYLRGDNYRESCYTCRFACIQREGDITLADYWNVSKYHKKLAENNDGVSLVLLNTDKATRVFQNISDKVAYEESKIEYAVKENRNLISASSRPKTRDIIYDKLKKDGFEKTSKELCKLHYIVPAIKRKTPKCVIKLLKSMR